MYRSRAIAYRILGSKDDGNIDTVTSNHSYMSQKPKPRYEVVLTVERLLQSVRCRKYPYSIRRLSSKHNRNDVKRTRCLVVTKALSGSRKHFRVLLLLVYGVMYILAMPAVIHQSYRIQWTVSIPLKRVRAGLSQSRKGDGLLGQRTARSPR